MALQECGCNGQLSGGHLDGEPWIERTTDIGYCPKHDAAPDLYKALKEEGHTAEGHGHPCQGCDAIRKAEG